MAADRSQACYASYRIEGTYPDSAGRLITALLRGLADVECRFEWEHDELLRWMLPEIVKCQLLRELEVRHGLACKTYVERLAQMYDHLFEQSLGEAGSEPE